MGKKGGSIDSASSPVGNNYIEEMHCNAMFVRQVKKWRGN